MHKIMAFAAVAGLLAISALIAYQGPGVMFTALAGIGWGFALVVLLHVLQLVCTGFAWANLYGRADQTPGVLIALRWIRESLNNLLPTAQIGGEIVAVRILALRGVRSGAAAASVIVDLTIELLSQIPFTLLGLALLLLDGFRGSAVAWTAIGLLISLPLTVLFIAAQQRGLFRWIEQIVGRLGARWSALDGLNVDGLHDRIHAIYHARGALFRAFGLHLLGWLLGAGEVWLILRLLGVPVSLQEAMVLESLGQAIRSAAFVIPAGVGVQEGGFMLLGALYGLTPEAGLALSLVKRVREILLGVPGLLTWQLMEGRRLWRAGRRPIAAEKRN